METRVIHYKRTKALYAKCTMSQLRSIASLLIAILTLTLLAGCAATGQSVRLPPVTTAPSGEIHVGKFVWIDLVTEDVPAASTF